MYRIRLLNIGIIIILYIKEYINAKRQYKWLDETYAEILRENISIKQVY